MTMSSSPSSSPSNNISSLEEVLEKLWNSETDQYRKLKLNKKQLGEQIFAGREKKSLVAFFLALLTEAKRYPIVKKDKKWFVDKNIGFEQLVAQCFLIWLLPTDRDERKKAKKEDKTKKEEVMESKKEREEKPIEPVVLSIEERLAVVKRLIRVSFPTDCKLWNLANTTLHLAEISLQFVQMIIAAAQKGEASFAVLIFCLHNRKLSSCLRPGDVRTVLSPTILLGPLRATTVEALAQNREFDFRENCRDVLLEAERGWARSQEEWLDAVAKLHLSLNLVPPFKIFTVCVQQLMRDLRGVHPVDDLVHVGWAFAAVKKYGKRYYEGNWRYENWHELLWTVLTQRPELKSQITRLIVGHFHDQEEANRWSQFNCRSSRRLIPLRGDEVINADKEEFLSLPDAISVQWIGAADEIQDVQKALLKVAESDSPFVGLDAEWSAYTGFSKATILQLATQSTVFIIDLDIDQTILRALFDAIFFDSRILKIGFGFSEDLVQLRFAVPSCPCLYKPKSLIDIEKLALKTKTTSNGEGDGVTEVDELIETGDNQGEKKTKDPGDETKQATPRGLSALCEKLLGKPLDKSEQCSVWNRRPLRPLQLRYAALDAFSMLQLFDKCRQMAAVDGRDAIEMAMEMISPETSLPLFFGDN